jgi:MtrB/PioB family decaheme-associated outer membrane protein
MRNTMTLAAALVLASSSLAGAQTAETTSPVAGTLDFGVRMFSTDGDFARMERYRDLRDGATTTIRLGKDTTASMWSVLVDNIGYRDQRYIVDYSGGRMKIAGSWDSIPLNYSYLTRTPWNETSTGIFALDASARAAVQSRVPGVVGIPTTAAQLATPSIFRGLASGFDLQSRRDTASLGFSYEATQTIGLNVNFSTTHKGGAQPYGMSFAFNNANELPMPLDNRANDVSAGVEWANQQGMFRVAWDGSWFDNRIHDITWDNPLRATDTNPFDPSAYVNGNGPARGRMSLPPSNSMNAVSASGNYKMAPRTTINGVFSFTAMRQNDTLIPWTINPVIANAAVFSAFPGLASLPRSTAEAAVDGLNGMINFTSRPNRYFGLQMRYRFNDHKNLTPIFDGREYVRFDAVPEETGGETEHFNIRRNTFDLIGTFQVAPYTNLRLGYTYDDFNRDGRSFSDSRDFILRASVDTIGNQYVMVRGSFEHATRIGSGFSESALEDGGSQPGLRFYDEADRTGNKGTILVVLTPVDLVDFQVSVSRGRDEYKGPGHEFGLLNNENTTYTAGLNVMPGDNVSLGLNYGREKFSSLQNSRNANPPGTDYGSWFDPNRTWTLNNDETVNTLDLYVDLKRTNPRADVRFDYTYSDSDNAFVHGGPRVQELLTNTALTRGDTPPCAAGLNSCFIPLPNVTNKWHRVGVDVRYFFTRRVGVGFADWYERFNISDFNSIDLSGQPGTPRIDYLGEINTGYGNRPYRGNTVFVRLLYLF